MPRIEARHLAVFVFMPRMVRMVGLPSYSAFHLYVGIEENGVFGEGLHLFDGESVVGGIDFRNDCFQARNESFNLAALLQDRVEHLGITGLCFLQSRI